MASPWARGNKALAAMKVLGFPSRKTKPILKNLLRACEMNWEHIEAENYRLLIEAILEEPEAEDSNDKEDSNGNKGSKKREPPRNEEPELYRKRLRPRQEEQRPACSVQSEGISLMKTPKVEPDDSTPGKVLPERSLASHSDLRVRNEANMGTEPFSAITSVRQENIEPAALHPDPQKKEASVVSPLKACVNGRPKERSVVAYQNQPSSERVQNLVIFKEPKIEPDLDSVPGAAVPTDKDAPITCEPLSFEVPIAIAHPAAPVPTGEEGAFTFPSLGHHVGWTS